MLLRFKSEKIFSQDGMWFSSLGQPAILTSFKLNFYLDPILMFLKCQFDLYLDHINQIRMDIRYKSNFSTKISSLIFYLNLNMVFFFFSDHIPK